MIKILIKGPERTIRVLEERLRYTCMIDLEISNHMSGCKIDARKGNEWITLCRFTNDENVNNILTMFRIAIMQNFHKDIKI